MYPGVIHCANLLITPTFHAVCIGKDNLYSFHRPNKNGKFLSSDKISLFNHPTALVSMHPALLLRFVRKAESFFRPMGVYNMDNPSSRPPSPSPSPSPTRSTTAHATHLSPLLLLRPPPAPSALSGLLPVDLVQTSSFLSLFFYICF